MRLGVDVGGTFTDAVLLDGDRVHTAKAPTTPSEPIRSRTPTASSGGTSGGGRSAQSR